MDSTELRKLLKYEEGAKLDFKIKLHEIYGADKDRQWDELIKDVLSLSNGNIGTAGDTGYLIIGAGDNLKPDGTRDLLDVGNISLSRKQLLDKVNSACEPTIDIECKKVSLDGKTLLVISVPPSPYIYKLRRQLKTPKKEFSPHTVLIRRKDGEKIYEASDEEKEALRTEKERCWNSGSHPKNSETSDSIDALVREVRSHYGEAILDSYSKIRLLDDTRIDVDLLYVDVYVLEKLSSKRYASISGLLEGVEQREDYERLALGQRQERLLGQEIVERFPRLMVLGKPGSGKTTFLRHLAVDCSKGKLFCDRIPVLIELRSIKEGNLFNLLNLIHQEFGLLEQEQTQQILNQGKAFILLDGLDEVPSQLRQSVRDQIYEFAKAKEYHQNRFVLTCRTQTTEYIADHFQPIEVADFDPKQVRIFARNWFTAIPETCSEAEDWTSRFVKKLEENKQIRELAVTPILLSLTCLLFTAEQNLPTKQSELYEKGINLLLKRWDRFREIPRDYQQLSISDKRKLLSYLAFIKFEQHDNFILFEQDEIEEYIIEYLGIDVDESEAILRAIEAHHGLLIERAQGFWSFSHLTFQEYFTAKYIVDSPTPEEAFQSLITHITEPRWREVFLLIVEMLSGADELLQLMKHQIDKLLTNDEKVQQLLERIYKIYSSQEFPFHFPVPLSSFKSISLSNLVVHSLYFECELRYIHDIALGLEIEQYQNQYKTIDLYSCYSVLFSRKYALKANRDIALRLEPKLRRASTKHMDSTFSNPIALKLFKLLDPVKRPTIYKIYEDENNQKNSSIFGAERAWWKTHGSSWNREFKSFIAKYRSQLNAKQLSKEQREKLRKYYDANVLLVDCLNSDCNVSPEVKKEIEKTLLWPIAEIERRKKMKDES